MAIAILLAAGCSGEGGSGAPSPGRVAERTERLITEQLEGQADVEVTVDCSRRFAVEPGATFSCVAGLEGQTVDYEVDIEEVDGSRVTTHSTNVQAMVLVELLLSQLVDQGLPEDATDAVDCEGQTQVIVRPVGGTFTCTGVLLADGRGIGTLEFTVEDHRGRVSWTAQRGATT